MRHREIAVAIVLASLIGCTSRSQEPKAEPFAGSTASIDHPRQGPVPGPELVAVRTERHTGFVRAVFEFRGKHLPGYHAGYLPHPARECGSGRPATVAGQARLQLRLSPARAHGENGRSPSFPTDLGPGPGPLLELGQTCDFEGVVSWVLGLRARLPYRVRELDHPARLVVDIADR